MREGSTSTRAEHPPTRYPSPVDQPATPAPPADDPAPDTSCVRTVVLFLTGQTISLFGSSLVQYAVMWYLTLQTKSGTVMMAYALFAFLPQGILSLVGGTLADRVSRKALIIVSDAAIALTTLALALVMTAGYTDLWLIYAAVFVRSVGAGFQQPAVGALLPQITPTAQLMRVNSINTTIQSALALVAPAAAGALYALGGVIPTFYVDVVTAIIGIGILARLPVPRAAARADNAERPTFLADLAGGVRYASRNPLVRWVLTVYAIVFMLTVAPSFLTPLMVARTFGDEVWKLTALEVVFSLGMTLGAAAVAVVAVKRSRPHMVLGACLVFGVLAIALGLSTNLWVFLALMFATGLAVPFFSTPSVTMLQEEVDEEHMGRVFSFVSIVFALAMPIGMIAFGPLADRWGVEFLLIASGVVTLVVVVVAAVIPDGRAVLAHGRASRGSTPGEDTSSAGE